MCQRAAEVPTTISRADSKMYPRLFFVATAQSTVLFKTWNLSRISLSSFLHRQGALSQVIAVILTLSDVVETWSIKGVMKLRVLTCWR